MTKLSYKAERAAWTAHVTGEKARVNKYGNEPVGQFRSKHEANVATSLCALELAGQIHELRMQVPIVLVEGKKGIRGITYVADFVYKDNDSVEHVLDAKGVRTAVFMLKKRLAALLRGITIEEIRAGRAPLLHGVQRRNRK